MTDTCTYCGKDLGGVYQSYWGNPCHSECNPENIAAAKERERLKQVGRDEVTSATPPAEAIEAPYLNANGDLIGHPLERSLREEFRRIARHHGMPNDGVIEADLVRAALAALNKWQAVK